MREAGEKEKRTGIKIPPVKRGIDIWGRIRCQCSACARTKSSSAG